MSEINNVAEDSDFNYTKVSHLNIEEESKLAVDSDLKFIVDSDLELVVNSNNNSITSHQHLFTSALRNVFLIHNITHVQGDAILRILRSHYCLSYLPCSTRTFLQTPKKLNYNIVPLGSGQYVHIGFEKTLTKIGMYTCKSVTY